MTNFSNLLKLYFHWVRGLVAINVGCEFRGRGSIPSVCQITDADLGQVEPQSIKVTSNECRNRLI